MNGAGRLNVECASCSDESMISMSGDMPPHDEATAMVALEQPEQTAAVAVASNAAAELVELPHQQQVASFFPQFADIRINFLILLLFYYAPVSALRFRVSLAFFSFSFLSMEWP